MNFVIRSLRLVSLFAGLAAMAAAAPTITEFMASNRQTLADNDGAYSDWIEIHNPDRTAIDLTGWHLTDNAAQKTKWQFPAVAIPANGYLVVFASDKDRRTAGAPLHTNFALSADGEYLALVGPDGVTIVSEFAPVYPSQTADISFGVASGGGVGFLGVPTPGAPNGAAIASTLSLVGAGGTAEVFSTSLPIVVLDNRGFGPQAQIDGEKEGSFRLLAGGGNFTSAAGLKVRGSSSADFPKKSYSIELHDATGANRAAALLGMAKVADWSLISPWQYDPSYLRNAYLYALSNSIGQWAPQTRFTEVFLNTDGAPLAPDHYLGIGVLTERIKIDSALVDLPSLASTDIAGEAVTGGYILKIDPKDDDEFGWTTERGIPEGIDGWTSLVVVSPKAAKLADEQRDYIQGYVQAFENALFADRESNWASREYLGYIDRASWVDFHLLQVLAKNPDGLTRSTYFTKNRGEKIKAGPVWDFDRAMGSVDPRSQAWDEWYEPTDASKLWEAGWWGVLADDPDFMQAWIDRWQSLRQGALASARLEALANTLAAQIEPSAAARDAARWSENASRFGTHRGEVDHLIEWLTNRANWIDEQFIAAPVPVRSEAGVQVFAPEGQLIAYTLDDSDPRASGGTPAANAVLVSTSLTLPAGVTATVRLYNPSTPVPAIGSAWSSAVVIDSSQTVNSEPRYATSTTGAQLAVISTRATLEGAGARFTTGVAVTGTGSKTFVVRAVGRTLVSLGVGNALLDPVLSIVAADGSVIAGNADWRVAAEPTAFARQSAAAGAFPLLEGSGDGRDAALVVTLTPGNYAIEVVSESGASGIVLAEVYAAGEASGVNHFSARTVLGAGGSFTSGVHIGGSEFRHVLLRAVGGDADPTLVLYSGTDVVASNDDWSSATNAVEIADASARAMLAPLAAGSRDAALLLRLKPATYTVQVGANSSTSGGVLLEVIELP